MSQECNELLLLRNCIPMSEATLEKQQPDSQTLTTVRSRKRKRKSSIALFMRSPQLFLNDLVQMYFRHKTNEASSPLVFHFNSSELDRRLSVRPMTAGNAAFTVSTPHSNRRKSCSHLKTETQQLENEVQFLEKFIKTLHELRNNEEETKLKRSWCQRQKCFSAPELSVRKIYLKKSHIEDEDNLTLYGHSMLPPSRAATVSNDTPMNLKTYLKHPKRQSSSRTECRHENIRKQIKTEELQLCVEGNQIQRHSIKTKEPKTKHIFISAKSKMLNKSKVK